MPCNCSNVPVNTNPVQDDIYIDFSDNQDLKTFVLTEYAKLIEKRVKIEKRIKKRGSKKCSKKSSKKCSKKSKQNLPEIFSIFIDNKCNQDSSSDSDSDSDIDLENKIIDACNCVNSRYYFKLKDDLNNGVSYWFANIYVKIPSYVDNTVKLGIYLRYVREANLVRTYVIENNLTNKVKKTAQIGSSIQTFYNKNDFYNAAYKNYLETNELTGFAAQTFIKK